MRVQHRRAAAAALTLAAGLSGALTQLPSAAAAPLQEDTQFYVPKPNEDAKQQIDELTEAGRVEDAALIRKMVHQPTAVWVTKGSPEEVETTVRATVRRAEKRNEVPVLVAYNLPFRDCSQYSAGGAQNVAEYKAWIDGFTAGLGDTEALVMLEPDGLGIIPWYTPMNGDMEWCQPAEADPDTAAAERFEMYNYAVDTLKGVEGTRVYLDGTHSGWLGVGDVSDRLIKAGVTRADGFFLNVSNYQATERLRKYGRWVSQCIYLDQNSWFQRDWCGSQYYPADPSDFSTWGATDETYDKAFADTGLDRRPRDMPHFVVDTSRNGQGAWTPPAGVYPDPQDWCNPPDRGLGMRPHLDNRRALLDAYLWLKVPGESDGQCSRGLTDNGGVDPEWGRVDPAAGHWFPEQALELVRLAVPEFKAAAR